MDERLAAFRACGPGTWQYNAANSFSPSGLTNTFYGIPFAVGNQWAAGQMIGASNQIKALVCHVSNYVDGGTPANGALTVTAPAILEWEIGNYIAYKSGYNPNGVVAHEAGNNNPCSCPSPSSTCFNNP